MCRKRIQGCACRQDLEKEKGLVEEERLRDCLLLGLGRWRKGRRNEWALRAHEAGVGRWRDDRRRRCLGHVVSSYRVGSEPMGDV